MGVAHGSVKGLLEDCAGNRLRDRAFMQISEVFAVLPGDSSEDSDAEKVQKVGKSTSHDAPGMLSVSKNGTCDGGFVLTLRKAPELDKKNVVFGKLLRGSAFLAKIAACAGAEQKEVRVASCGELLGGQN